MAMQDMVPLGLRYELVDHLDPGEKRDVLLGAAEHHVPAIGCAEGVRVGVLAEQDQGTWPKHSAYLGNNSR